MKISGKIWITLLILALATLAAQVSLVTEPTYAAGPWYVGPGGSDGSACTSPATRCATINGAIAKASAGDEIRVAIGTYTGSGSEVVLLDKDVTLTGGWNSNFTTQNGMSTIDGETSRRGITVNNGVTATVERFMVQNGSGINGAGISNFGTLTLKHSNISGNSTTSSGGGIYNPNGKTLILKNSTVSGNSTVTYGGGIYAYESTVVLNNSTVSGNRAGSTGSWNGGGVWISGNNYTLTLNSSTVSNNTAGSSGGGIYSGGGLNSTVTLRNTLLAGNMATNGRDCAGSFVTPISSSGYNLIGNTSGCTFTPTTGDLTNVDPKLGPLQGSPGYHPLLSGSPAINTGNPSGCIGSTGLLTTDQRGVPRVDRCDIGAYEYGLSATKSASGDYTPGKAVTYKITLNNEAGTDITGLAITDTLPGSLAYVPDSFSASNGTGGESGGTVTWSGLVPANGSATVSFQATVDSNLPSCSFITNKAIIGGTGFEFDRELTGTTPCACNLTKATGNPVLSVGADGTWEDEAIWQPTVLKDGGTYKMWYFGFDGTTSQIGYATSPDGVNWTKHGGNPVLSPSQSWEGSRVIAPTVIKDGSTYKMWYVGIDSSSGVSRIGYATSSNGTSWTKHGGNPVLDVGAADSWEDEDVRSPTVLKMGSTYHMWYEGDDGATIRIGHATSTDGVTWSKDPANPVLDVGPSGDWDWLDVYGPSVVNYNGSFLLWYSGYTLPAAWETGYALSTDGTNWTRQEVLIPQGPLGDFDDASADYPAAMVDGDLFKVWYSGVKEGGTYNIGYASAEICSQASPAPSSGPIYLPIVLKGGTSSAPPSCPAYYTDNFSDPGSGWFISDSSTARFAYVGGNYQIWLKNPSWFGRATPGAKATDFTAAVSARRASGSRGSYGIHFGINEDWSEYYEFRIGISQYRLQRCTDVSCTVLKNWSNSGSIKTGTGVNRMKIIRQGNSITLYNNNQFLTTITDGTYTGLRRLGLFAASSSAGPLDVRFDNFSLYPASCGVEAAEAGEFEMGKPEIHQGAAPPGLDEAP